MTLAAFFAVALGMALVRLGWGGRRRVSIAGWALAVTALVMLTWQAGAWGAAIGTLVGIVVALAAVLLAGWRSPVRSRRPARQAPSVSLPVRASDIGRRAAVFVLVVPGAFAAAQWLALAAQRFARGHSAVEADGIALAWLVQPLAWGAIMTVQMTRAGAGRMIAAPAVAAAMGALLWMVS